MCIYCFILAHVHYVSLYLFPVSISVPSPAFIHLYHTLSELSKKFLIFISLTHPFHIFENLGDPFEISLSDNQQDDLIYSSQEVIFPVFFCCMIFIDVCIYHFLVKFVKLLMFCVCVCICVCNLRLSICWVYYMIFMEEC